jgi:hypothetical protein
MAKNARDMVGYNPPTMGDSATGKPGVLGNGSGKGNAVQPFIGRPQVDPQDQPQGADPLTEAATQHDHFKIGAGEHAGQVSTKVT